MNDQEKHLFDLRGYLLVENALTQDQTEFKRLRLEKKREQKKCE